MADANLRRIVLLGKTGSGKSSLANTILGEEVFNINHSPTSETKTCQSITKSVNGYKIHLTDTPGFFHTDPEVKNAEAVVKCVTRCTPGPHAFLIVLKMGKYTEQERALISAILKYFSDEVLQFATVVFTHGDQLPKKNKIGDFVSENPDLNELVEKCGGRCHVFDNEFWNDKKKDDYRSNRFQIQELLKTIDQIVEDNQGGCYTSEKLQSVEEDEEQDEEGMSLQPGNIKEWAKRNIFDKILPNLGGTVTGILLGAFLSLYSRDVNPFQ